MYIQCEITIQPNFYKCIPIPFQHWLQMKIELPDKYNSDAQWESYKRQGDCGYMIFMSVEKCSSEKRSSTSHWLCVLFPEVITLSVLFAV